MSRRAMRVLPAPAAVAMAVMLAAALVVGPAPAEAHSQLLSTSPADGAVLGEPPATVVLTFNEALIPDVDSISINDDMGNVVASRSVEPVGATLSVPWPAGLPAGVYQVAYRVVSGDGHPVIGAISFTITGAGSSAGLSAPNSGADPVGTAEPATAESAAATVAAEGSAALPVVAAGLAVVLLAGGAVWLVRRRVRHRGSGRGGTGR